MVSENFLANAVAGITARACDSCIRKRARWYCAADDAFLCPNCDLSIHSANPLASRHERVRLKIALMKVPSFEPSWHQGFTKKARTPRYGKHLREAKSDGTKRNQLHFVPELISPQDNSYKENHEHEQLIYRVPIFDPFASESSLESAKTAANDHGERADDYKLGMCYSSDMDLEGFAADVENLLCKGLDEESFDLETLGFLDCPEKDTGESCSWSNKTVKLEEKEMEVRNYQIDAEIDMTMETFELNFDESDSLANYEEDDKAAVGGINVIDVREECELGNEKQRKREVLLALDYEGVLEAWADQKSAWITGDRPELDENDCWPDCMGGCGSVHKNPTYGGSTNAILFDGGREARVSRYREKRRTRLFSKKIRYEVRKLNAEKRPRMKGRFVKRPSFAVN